MHLVPHCRYIRYLHNETLNYYYVSLLPVGISTNEFLTENNTNALCLYSIDIRCVIIAHNNNLGYYVVLI